MIAKTLVRDLSWISSFFSSAIIYRWLSVPAAQKVAALPWFDLNLNFGASYIRGVSPYTPAPTESVSVFLSLSLVRPSPFLSLFLFPFLPFNLHVHPVNYFVSGYLQRAVNSCRADYTDRFIALVSQSNVRNAPIPTTHSPSLVLFLSSFTLPYFRVLLFLCLSLSLSRCNVISLTSRESV